MDYCGRFAVGCTWLKPCERCQAGCLLCKHIPYYSPEGSTEEEVPQWRTHQTQQEAQDEYYRQVREMGAPYQAPPVVADSDDDKPLVSFCGSKE